MIAMKNFIHQAEEKGNKLMKKPEKNKQHRKEPYAPIKLAVRFANYFSENAVTNVIKRIAEVFHTITRQG